jgi:hypothetical protein
MTEIMTPHSENHTTPINTLCGQNAELVIVTACGTYRYHCSLKSYGIITGKSDKDQ